MWDSIHIQQFLFCSIIRNIQGQLHMSKQSIMFWFVFSICFFRYQQIIFRSRVSIPSSKVMKTSWFWPFRDRFCFCPEKYSIIYLFPYQRGLYLLPTMVRYHPMISFACLRSPCRAGILKSRPFLMCCPSRCYSGLGQLTQ